MAYSIELADRIRLYLSQIPKLKVEEKKMFRGISFMVNGKMCVNVSNDNLMCRFDPLAIDPTSRKGYLPMVMKGRVYKGYCYITPEGYKSKRDFEFWMKCCLEFNSKAKASRKSKAT